VLDKLLAAAATNAKLVIAAAAGAALVAGGGAVAITNVADSAPAGSVSEQASERGAAASAAKGDNRSDTATAGIKPPKTDDDAPDAEPKDKADNHGACVSEAAHTTTATGRARGEAISTIAKSDCGKDAKAGDDEKTKPTKPAGDDTDADDQDDDAEDDESDADEDEASGPSQNGRDHGKGHAKKK
jgi:hypothetical protein